jgi:predicted alpha/beta hydrolase
VSGVMRDWAYEARTGRYRLHGDDFDYEAALAALTTPVHLVALEGDSMIPPAAVHHLAARIGVAASQTTLPAGSSGAAGFDHFTWARRTPDAIIDDVENWLARSGL